MRPSRVALALSVAFLFCSSAHAGHNVWTSGGPTNIGGVNPWITSLASDRALPLVVYGGSLSPDIGVVKTTDGGQTWFRSGAGLSGCSVYSVATDPVDPSTVYATCPFVSEGLFRSVDAGATWLKFGDGISAGNPYSVAVNSSVLYVGMTPGGGVFKRSPASPGWLSASNGLPSSIVVVLAVDPTDPNVVYAGTGAGLYKTANGGVSWQPLSPGHDVPEGREISDIVIDPSATAVVYAAVLGGGVQKTLDGGTTWVRLPGISTISAMAIDPTHPSTIYAGNFLAGVFRSDDGGSTWADFSEGIPPSPNPISSLTIDATGTVLHAAVGRSGVYDYVRSAAPPGACSPNTQTLCLGALRFSVAATWRTADGATGIAHVLPLSDESGAMWFFTSGNFELMVKVVDGRALNGKFWVFVGGLTDVEYDLVITDTQTGAVWRHHNAHGDLTSLADTSAF